MKMKPGLNEQTYVCSVVFLDIVQFSQQSNAAQSAWRNELATLLDRGLEGMDPDNRIIVDTGDGAAIAFLLHPEEALSFVRHIYGELPKLRNFAIRVGAHLGPLRVVLGMNGHPNIVGDGINAAQRVMGFAGINEVLVSRAFHEAVIWLSSGNSTLFSPHGKQADKHGRDHDLFRVGSPPTPAPSNVQTADTAPPTAEKSSGFGVNAGIGAVLTLVVGIGLGIVLRNRELGQTASPPVAGYAEPGSATLAAPPAKLTQAGSPPVTLKVGHPPMGAQPNRGHSTVAAVSGEVVTAKDELNAGSAICPDCSCTDLMTKLSLGIPLDEKGRRYINENCKK